MNERLPAVLEARQITKRYGSVTANDSVDLQLNSGEVHALLGENGAGKSTLSKILYGFTRADSGQILSNGSVIELHSPRDARRVGTGMVFQNFMLVPALSVLENIALFLPNLPRILRPAALARRIRQRAEQLGLAVDLRSPVRQLSVGSQQKVEILKLLLADARVLILDEPTKVLAPHEVEDLLRTFDALKKEGYSILFITHKLREVLACADRITVMRHGRVSGELSRSEASEETLVSMMFESAPARPNTDPAGGFRLSEPPPRADAHTARLLELQGASSHATGSETILRDIELSVGEGEIVGIAGVSGNGQKELGDLVLGLRPLSRGRRMLFGAEASAWSVERIRQAGVAVIPEDALGMAAVPLMSVRENLSLGTGHRYHRGTAVDWRALESDMSRSFERLRFPVPNLDAPVRSLSGGNVQRMVVAREMAASPRLIVALYPTRGLDVRSTAAVRGLLRAARDEGRGVLLVSEDLDELAEMSDRLLVMFQGGMVGAFPRGAWTPAQVGRLMTGSGGDPRAG